MDWKYLKIIYLGLLLCSFSRPAIAIQIDSLYLADSLFQNYQYEQALEMFYALQRSNPDDPKYAYKLAVCYENTGNIRDAAIYYDRTLKIRPDHIPALRQAAQIKGKAGNIEGANKLLKRILAIDSLNGHYYYLLGNNYLKQNDPAGARRAYQRAVELNKWDAHSTLALGEMYFSAGKYDQAILTAIKCPDFKTPGSDLQMLVVKSYYRQEKYNDVITTAVAALQADRDSLLWGQYIGYSYYFLNNYESCIPWLQYALQQRNITEAGLSYLAHACQKTGKDGLALLYFEMAVELGKSSFYSGNLHNLGLLNADAGNLNKAYQYLEQAYHYTNDTDILYNMGVIAYEKKDVKKAKIYWNRYLKAGGKKYAAETKKRLSLL